MIVIGEQPPLHYFGFENAGARCLLVQPQHGRAVSINPGRPCLGNVVLRVAVCTCVCFDDPNLSRYLHLISHIGHRQRWPRLANLLPTSGMMVRMADCRFPMPEQRYILSVRVEWCVHLHQAEQTRTGCFLGRDLAIPSYKALIVPHIQDLAPTRNRGFPQDTQVVCPRWQCGHHRGSHVEPGPHCDLESSSRSRQTWIWMFDVVDPCGMWKWQKKTSERQLLTDL